MQATATPWHDSADELEEGEVIEDFYGIDASSGRSNVTHATHKSDNSAVNNVGSSAQAVPGALGNAATQAKQAASDDRKKAANLTKLQALREKLIAQRQNSPGNKSQPTRASPTAQPPAYLKLFDRVSPVDNQAKIVATAEILGLDTLIAEGRAAAEAKSAAADTLPSPASLRDAHALPAPAAQVSKVRELGSSQGGSKEVPREDASAQYYRDLPAWLEMTGYHNVNYRSHKLRTHRERQALMEEAARISAKLERLKQEEDAEMRSVPANAAHPTAAEVRAPPIPTDLLMGRLPRSKMNSAKRDRSPHSPWSERPATRVRHSGHRQHREPQFSYDNGPRCGSLDDAARDRSPPAGPRQSEHGQRRSPLRGRESGFRKW